MSEQALRRAVKLVNQFMNRTPGERRGPPVSAGDLTWATACAERGDLSAAIATLRYQESKTVYHRWHQTDGIFGEWVEDTGSNVHAFSQSRVCQERFTEDEAYSIVSFLQLHARFILDEIENEEEVGEEEEEEEEEDGPVLHRVHKPPVTPVDQGIGKYGRQQRAAHDPYEPLHEEEGGPGFRM